MPLFAYSDIRGDSVYRPIVDVIIVNGKAEFPCLAIVDTGADVCAFPMLFASELGLDPLGQTPLPVVGAGVGGACDAFYFEVILRVELLGEFRVRAAFVETLNTVGFGLLGHGGFLDQVQATFATNKRVFSVTRNEDIKT